MSIFCLNNYRYFIKKKYFLSPKMSVLQKIVKIPNQFKLRISYLMLITRYIFFKIRLFFNTIDLKISILFSNMFISNLQKMYN